MTHETTLRAIIAGDPLRMAALIVLRDLDLPDGWIAAGFVRDAVWDHLHGRGPCVPVGDVDVVWFDRARTSPEEDRALEARLRQAHGAFDWSVKNQARMHLRNGDAPYDSVAQAMTAWPETATAIAVRLDADGTLEFNAPLGLDDLFAPRLVPTAAFAGPKKSVFAARVADKRWCERYPLLMRN